MLTLQSKSRVTTVEVVIYIAISFSFYVLFSFLLLPFLSFKWLLYSSSFLRKLLSSLKTSQFIIRDRYVIISFGYRYLESDFILVQARLLVPCAYLTRKVPYKYIVLKEKRKNSKEEPKHLWETLAGLGVYKNRCLQVPNERCQSEGASYNVTYTLICVIQTLPQASNMCKWYPHNAGRYITNEDDFK